MKRGLFKSIRFDGTYILLLSGDLRFRVIRVSAIGRDLTREMFPRVLHIERAYCERKRVLLLQDYLTPPSPVPRYELFYFSWYTAWAWSKITDPTNSSSVALDVVLRTICDLFKVCKHQTVACYPI